MRCVLREWWSRLLRHKTRVYWAWLRRNWMLAIRRLLWHRVWRIVHWLLIQRPAMLVVLR